MQHPLDHARSLIELDELIALLVEDYLRNLPASEPVRSAFELGVMARFTLAQSGFPELRPVTLHHPMVDHTIIATDTSDDMITAAIGVLLDGGPDGYPLSEVFDFLKDRTVRWSRKDVTALLLKAGQAVPAELQPLVPVDPPRREEPTTRTHTLTRRTHRLAGVIKLAQAEAADPDDWQSVWPCLLQMAQRQPPKQPLVGAADGEIKYFTGKGGTDEIAFMNRETFGQWFRRNKSKTDG